MATEPKEITVDMDALDADAAKKTSEKPKSTTDETPAVVVEPEIAATAAEKPVVTPEEGLEKLKKQLENERNARIAAEQMAREAAQAEVKARSEVQSSQLDQIKGAIEQITQQTDILEQQYEAALAAQDFKGAAKIQRSMSTNAARLAQLEAGKTQLENAPKPVPRAPVDPVEAFCANLSPASAAWVRAHPEFARDKHKYEQMVAAHQLAVARGYKPDTEGYFKSVEKTLDLTTPSPTVAPHADDPEPTTDAAARATGGRNSAPPSAPVSRSGNGTGSRSNVVRLTPDEVEMAENMGMTVEEYARHKVALKREGKLS